MAMLKIATLVAWEQMPRPCLLPMDVQVITIAKAFRGRERRGAVVPWSRARNQTRNSEIHDIIMKQTLISNHFSLAVAAGLALSAVSTQAQDVAVTDSLTYVAAGGGVFDYTLTLHNTGSEAVEGLWLGWALSSSPVFNVLNPTAAANNLGWADLVDGNSVKYGGSSSETTILSGGSGTFTFNSTSTPAQFMSGAAGQSVAYGVNATQFAIEDNSLHSVEFLPTVVLIPPTVSITNPASGAVFAAPANVTFQAAVTNGSGTVTNVLFLVGSIVLTNETSAPFSAVTNNLTAGSYTLSAIASDNSGLNATNTVTISVVTPVTVLLTNSALISGANFHFSYLVNTGLSYVVQFSTNLGGATWIPLVTNVALSNPVVFVDVHATNKSGFYRVGRMPNP
jgi:hypothetical protein